MDLRPWMEQWKMLPPEGGSILCALSGGRDSVCLLHYLIELSGGRFRVAAAHFNHQMRPTADRDEAFVRRLCEEWNVPLQVGRGDVSAAAKENGWSTEEAARRLRYDFLARAADSLGARRIATAHHMEDQAETVLLHLLRGTGAEGLGGIPPVRGRLIRPLLETPRSEIDAYVALHRLPFVEDETNAEDRYTRNRLRLRVMPLLEEIHPAAVRNICRASRILRKEDACLDALAAQRIPPEGTTLSARGLLEAPEALRPRMVRLLLERLPAGKRDFGAPHLEAVVGLAASGGMLDLPGGVRAACRDGLLTLTCRIPVGAAALAEGETRWGDYVISCHRRGENFSQKEGTILLNCGKIEHGLKVRSPVGADRLTLPLARGSRSVKRLLADRGVLPEDRERIPVICAGDRAIAVYGLGADVAFLPEGSGDVIEITIERRGGFANDKEQHGSGYPEGPADGGDH